jgi:hypothetical protein
VTPSFINIKKRKTKRLSPYSENEIWEREELLSILKYEPFTRNKAALTLFWDLDAKPHEITLLKIKDIKLRGGSKGNYGQITSKLAAELRQQATAIQDELGCSSSSPVPNSAASSSPFWPLSPQPSSDIAVDHQFNSPPSTLSLWP